MDYETSYDKFIEVLPTFAHDKDVQIMLILTKMNNFIESYDTEVRDEAKAECVANIAKLNRLHTTILVQKARETLGVVHNAPIDEVRRRKNMMLKAYVGYNSDDNVRMYSKIVRAFDLIDCFR